MEGNYQLPASVERQSLPVVVQCKQNQNGVGSNALSAASGFGVANSLWLQQLGSPGPVVDEVIEFSTCIGHALIAGITSQVWEFCQGVLQVQLKALPSPISVMRIRGHLHTLLMPR